VPCLCPIPDHPKLPPPLNLFSPLFLRVIFPFRASARFTPFNSILWLGDTTGMKLLQPCPQSRKRFPCKHLVSFFPKHRLFFPPLNQGSLLLSPLQLFCSLFFDALARRCRGTLCLLKSFFSLFLRFVFRPCPPSDVVSPSSP